MGTNFYVRYNICPHCHKYDEIHVGKASFGWEFSFKAVDINVSAIGLDPKITLLENNNMFIKISSYKEWKEFFKKYVIEYETAKIFDEYGMEVSINYFYKMVEENKGGKSHAKEMKTNPMYKSYYSSYNDFIDEEGNSFSRVEFS